MLALKGIKARCNILNFRKTENGCVSIKNNSGNSGIIVGTITNTTNNYSETSPFDKYTALLKSYTDAKRLYEKHTDKAHFEIDKAHFEIFERAFNALERHFDKNKSDENIKEKEKDFADIAINYYERFDNTIATRKKEKYQKILNHPNCPT